MTADAQGVRRLYCSRVPEKLQLANNSELMVYAIRN
jgi:hypothetical protein